MPIYPPTDENIEKAAALLKEGGLVSFPTETVYGLGASAFNPAAVARIFEVKQRPSFDPIIVHIAALGQLSLLTPDVSDRIIHIAQKFWPGPLTIVMDKTETVPDIVTAGLSTVAVRMPRHPVSLRLIEWSGSPIAAPSANRFGSVSPTEAAHVEEQLGDGADMIIDGGKCEVGIESTIIKLERDSVILLRPGGVPVEEIEAEIGKVTVPETHRKIEAPGQLPYHYSPRTPVKLVKKIRKNDMKYDRAGFLFYKSGKSVIKDERAEFLSRGGDLREAASNLFAALHRLDRLGLDVILAEEVPGNGLGLAIMDRLLRASKKREDRHGKR